MMAGFMSPTPIELAGTFLFALAVLHTFLCNSFKRAANHFPEGSIRENFFQLLGEVEVVFGFWAGILLLSIAFITGKDSAIQYAESRNFREPLFVFAIMAVAATRPILDLTSRSILFFSRVLPVKKELGVYASCLILGPLLGSFITEPAAMTVTAMILHSRYYERSVSLRFKYLTLAVLFVNISIGGVLTPYAAPPVLMVAEKWNWDLAFMLSTFGWKAALATFLNAVGATFVLRSELKELEHHGTNPHSFQTPLWLSLTHVFFLICIVLTAHFPVIFLGLFMFFLGAVAITREFQDELKLKESLLVSFFLSGLVMLGGLQDWWLENVFAEMKEVTLFLASTGLTAVTDNAALTYLGSQVEGVSDGFKYALMAGAIAGGGLTVIANAPNPAGFAILQERFGREGISPLKLFLFALSPTFVAMGCLWLL